MNGGRGFSLSPVLIPPWLRRCGVYTFQGFGEEVGCWLVLLHVVPLHDLALLVQAQVPAPSRLLLPVDHRRVRHVVVLKHRLLELTLRCKVFLERGGERERQRERLLHGCRVVFLLKFLLTLYYFSLSSAV